MSDTFEQWMSKVDAVLVDKVGMCHRDLPDMPYYDFYEDMLEPNEAASEVAENMWN